MTSPGPVTGNEISFPGETVLVSRTDLRGVINYANEAFVTVSGYARDELLGSPHNLVRHPDMPSAAFENLWQTVRNGQAWRGLVKNRARNGDFYWVEAFVTPFHDNGKLVGFQSIRRKPTREQVNTATLFYKQVRAGAAQFPTRKDTLLQKIPYTTRSDTIGLLVMLLALGSGTAGYLHQPVVALLLGLVAGLGTGVTCWWNTTRVHRPLVRAMTTIRNLAEGRLDQPLDIVEGEEFRDLLDAAETLRIRQAAMVLEVQNTARRLKGETSRIEEEIQGLESRLLEQSNRTSDATDAIEHMAASIRQVSLRVRDTEAQALAADAVVQDVNRAVQHELESSLAIVSTVNDSSANIDELSRAVQLVGQASAEIKEIAKQTNLLALNAAIEAARAGEQGRGFAVVADEVRRLATRTASSTDKISEIICQVSEATRKSLAAMGSTRDQVSENAEQAGAVSRSLTRVTDASQQILLLASGNTEALGEQDASSRHLAGAIETVKDLAASNERAFLELANTARSVDHTALELTELVAHYAMHR